MILCEYIIWFVFYSFVGWFYETILCSIAQRKFVKRGFLNGPYCPIYGFGAVLDLIIFGYIDNVVMLFLLGAVVNCSLEYFTSWLLEVCFHARWWDYSKRKFNIKGRVCLIGAVVFGLFAVAMVKFIHPPVAELTNKLSQDTVIYWGIALLAIIEGDTIFTITQMASFNTKLKEIQEYVETIKNETKEKIIVINDLREEKYKNVALKLNFQQRNFMKSFPQFHSTKYTKVTDELKIKLELLKKQKKSSDK